MAGEIASAGLHVQAQNLPGFAFGDDFERATADFAVGREALAPDAGVDGDLEGLATVRATDGLGLLHPGSIPRESPVGYQQDRKSGRAGRRMSLLAFKPWCRIGVSEKHWNYVEDKV